MGGDPRWAAAVGNAGRAGTPALEAGHPVLVEVDLAGARAVRRGDAGGNSGLPGAAELGRTGSRLTGRGTESAEVVARRLETAKVELAAKDEFDTVIVNEDVDRACESWYPCWLDAGTASESNTADLD